MQEVTRTRSVYGSDEMYKIRLNSCYFRPSNMAELLKMHITLICRLLEVDPVPSLPTARRGSSQRIVKQPGPTRDLERNECPDHECCKMLRPENVALKNQIKQLKSGKTTESKQIDLLEQGKYAAPGSREDEFALILCTC